MSQKSDPQHRPLSSFERERYEKKRQVLQLEWDRRHSKLGQLRLDYAKEAGSSVRFQLQGEVEAQELALAQLEGQLEAIERALETGVPTTDGPTEPQSAVTPLPPSVADPQQETQQGKGDQEEGTGRTQATITLSAYDESTWVGRDSLIATLTTKLSSGCRILTLLGITGIGKTALAERVVLELGALGKPFCRLNFDDRGQDRDFLSAALALLPKLGEVVTTADQQAPENALRHLLQVLRTKPFLLQIDSVEMLLEGDEQQGWNAFSDRLWIDFFQQVLAGDECQSHLILTTQAMPEELDVVGSRYSRCWHVQPVGGLSDSEQDQLFRRNGLGLDADGLLMHIGSLYDGHPLVLQIIAKDILEKPFNGNVSLYWQCYQAEFEEVESDRTRKRSSPKALQLRVKQRVRQSLERLPAGALQMVCRSSVYRRPVSEVFWMAMLWDSPEDDQWQALEVLRSHSLVEEEIRGDGMVLLRQHNLIKRVGNELLRAKQDECRQAHQVAARMWLESYEPKEGAPNLEQVRGNLEAFHHHCEIGEWEAAKEILLDQGLGNQLLIWSYSREIMPLYQRLLGKIGAAVDVNCERGIGNACYSLSNYPQAIEHHQQSLKIAHEIDDFDGQGKALCNFGIVYEDLGDYSQAIEYYQQSLAIAREIGDRQGEGVSLGNLGSAYYRLCNYQQSIKYHQQHLTIARDVGDRQGEGLALGSLGCAYYSLGNYQQAIEYHQQDLTIARDVGDRQGEGLALVNWGCALLKLEQYSEAHQHLQAALQIFQVIGDRRNEAEALLRLGELHYKTHQPDLTLSYCNQSLSIARELGIPLVKECENLLTTLQAEGHPQTEE